MQISTGNIIGPFLGGLYCYLICMFAILSMGLVPSHIQSEVCKEEKHGRR